MKSNTLTLLIVIAKLLTEARIDTDVFELFLTTGTHKGYAEKFLAPEQMDEIDVAKYLKN